jgi:hypothetical protein
LLALGSGILARCAHAGPTSRPQLVDEDTRPSVALFSSTLRLHGALTAEAGGASAAGQESAVTQRDAPLDATEVDARTRFLIERLDARKRHATLWYRSWFAVYAGGAAFGALRAGLADHEGTRTDSIVSGVKSLVGLTDLLLRPIEARHGADGIRGLPADTPDERLARMQAAEKQLESNAERARHVRDWRVHLSSLALNLAGGAVLWIGGSPVRAAESVGIGIVASEIAIYTEPVTPAKDWDEYQGRKASAQWAIAALPTGLAFYSEF